MTDFIQRLAVYHIIIDFIHSRGQRYSLLFKNHSLFQFLLYNSSSVFLNN